MNEKERKARDNKNNGNNCSNSIYKVFEEEYKLDGIVPVPRSIEGKCGAVLTTEKILRELGQEILIPQYEEWFQKQFGYLKCVELMTHEKRCNDYVGLSTEFLCNMLEKE